MAVETSQGDAIVTFNDGKTAIYPAVLLHSLLAQVRDITSERLPIPQSTDLPRDVN